MIRCLSKNIFFESSVQRRCIILHVFPGWYKHNEGGLSVTIGNTSANISSSNNPTQARTSNCSLNVNEVNPVPNSTTSKDQIQKNAANHIPISQLPREYSRADPPSEWPTHERTDSWRSRAFWRSPTGWSSAGENRKVY